MNKIIVIAAISAFWAGWASALPATSTTTPSTAPATRPVSLRNDVSVDEFEKLRNEKKYVVLDVRSAKEFKANHIPGAINLDVNSTEFEQKVKELDKEQVYLVHCALGVRSVRACDKMEKLKFAHLYNLQGGFEAWRHANKPQSISDDAANKKEPENQPGTETKK